MNDHAFKPDLYTAHLLCSTDFSLGSTAALCCMLLKNGIRSEVGKSGCLVFGIGQAKLYFLIS